MFCAHRLAYSYHVSRHPYSAMRVLLIRRRMLCPSRWVIPGPGRGGNGTAGRPAGSRQQPVFGRLPASGEMVGVDSRGRARAGVTAPVRGQARRLTGVAAANTRATQVRVQEASNTPVTRTKRHSPAHLGMDVKIVVSAQLPGWMRSAGLIDQYSPGGIGSDRPSIAVPLLIQWHADVAQSGGDRADEQAEGRCDVPGLFAFALGQRPRCWPLGVERIRFFRPIGVYRPNPADTPAEAHALDLICHMRKK